MDALSIARWLMVLHVAIIFTTLIGLLLPVYKFPKIFVTYIIGTILWSITRIVYGGCIISMWEIYYRQQVEPAYKESEFVIARMFAELWGVHMTALINWATLVITIYCFGVFLVNFFSEPNMVWMSDMVIRRTGHKKEGST